MASQLFAGVFVIGIAVLLYRTSGRLVARVKAIEGHPKFLALSEEERKNIRDRARMLRITRLVNISAIVWGVVLILNSQLSFF